MLMLNTLPYLTEELFPRLGGKNPRGFSYLWKRVATNTFILCLRPCSAWISALHFWI